MHAKGFTDEALAKIQDELPKVFDITFAFNKFVLGEEFCKEILGISGIKLDSFDFNMLGHLGFTDQNIEEAIWDGKQNNKPLPSDVYVYMIEIEYNSGKRELFSGDITLLR